MTAVANVGVLGLGNKLGPILWQLPPNLSYDFNRMADFMKLLPRSMSEAADLASRHDDKLAKSEKVCYEIPPGVDPAKRIRYTFEVRHDSFACDGFYELLKQHNAALVVADTAGKFPYIEQVCHQHMFMCDRHMDPAHSSCCIGACCNALYRTAYRPALLASICFSRSEDVEIDQLWPMPHVRQCGHP